MNVGHTSVPDVLNCHATPHFFSTETRPQEEEENQLSPIARSSWRICRQRWDGSGVRGEKLRTFLGVRSGMGMLQNLQWSTLW